MAAVTATLPVRMAEGSGAGRLFISPGGTLRPETRPQSLGVSAPADLAPNAEAPGACERASAANLAKNIIGAGVLALPNGAAQVVHQAQSIGLDTPTATAGVVLLFSVFGALNAYGFFLLGEVCARTGARSYQSAWIKTMGKDLAWVPSAASFICCLTGCVACASVIGDTATELLAAFSGLHLDTLGHNGLLCALASMVVFPLCMLPSLSPLAFASLLGLVGITVLAIMMVVRCFDGSYMPGGEFNQVMASQLDQLPGAQEQADVSVPGLVGRTLLFCAVLSNAYSAHFNAPAIYEELTPEAGEGERRCKLSSFRDVTLVAFGFSGLLFSVVTLTGMQTFGVALLPSVLSNYANGDFLATLARMGLCLCVLFEFPLLERPCRTALAELLGLSEETAKQPLVVGLSVALSIVLACTPGLGLDKVSAIGGALGASLLIYVAPALMALKLKEAGPREKEALADSPAWTAQAYFLRGVAGFGATLGGLGVAEAAGFGGF